MHANIIARVARITPAQRFLLSAALPLLLTFSSGACFQSAEATVQFNENSGDVQDLFTPVAEWKDDSVQPEAMVLCIHGFTIHGTAFDSLARNLASQGFLVYAPDLRGFGRTYFNGQDRRVSYDTFADSDVAALALSLRKAHPDLKLYVCGESMGGTMALRLAVAKPELVDGLILSAPCLKLKMHARLVVGSIVSIIFRGGRITLSRQILRFGGSAEICRKMLDDPLVRTRYRVSELLQLPRMARHTRRLVRRVPSHIPVLILQSHDDQTVNPVVVKILLQRLQTEDLTIVQFESKGHLLLELQNPESDTLQQVSVWLSKRQSTDLD